MKIFFLPIFLSNYLTQVFGYEVDNFTNRYKLSKLEDSARLLNIEINDTLKFIISEKNNQLVGCQPVKNPSSYSNIEEIPLLSEIKKALVGRFSLVHTNYVKWAQKLDSIDKYRASPHIYAHSNVPGIDYSIRIGNNIIGTDKLGHFLDLGFTYFDTIVKDKGKLTNALNYGYKTEEGEYGKELTHIHSNADLSANLSGSYFWHNLLFGPSPFIKCENGNYKLLKHFDWNDYVHPAWDEALNCSEYTEGLKKVVDENLKAAGLTCPLNTDLCLKVITFPCANSVVHQSCLSWAKKNEMKRFIGKCPLSNFFEHAKSYPQTKYSSSSKSEHRPSVQESDAVKKACYLNANDKDLVKFRDLATDSDKVIQNLN